MPAATVAERARQGNIDRLLAIRDPPFRRLQMKTKHFAAAAMALALGIGTALPARADMGDITFNMIFEMADRDANKLVTKQEFLEAMGKAYDMKMKAMKGDAKMVKGDAMTRDGLKDLIADIYKGA
jgi:hypothetical protein